MVITILHVTLSARPTKKRDDGEKKEKEEEEKAEEAKEEEEEKEDQFWREMATVQDEGETRARRMWTLTALQYTQGHGIYKPPQFYLHPSRAYITPHHQD